MYQFYMYTFIYIYCGNQQIMEIETKGKQKGYFMLWGMHNTQKK